MFTHEGDAHIETADQVYNETNEFVYLEGNAHHNADLSIEVNRRIRNPWCSLRKYTIEHYDRPSASLELKFRMLRAEVLTTWSVRACHHDTLRRVHHSFLTCCVGWQENNRPNHSISYLLTLVKMGSEREYRGDYAHEADPFGGICEGHETAYVRGVRRTGGERGGQENEWMGCFLDDLKAFKINADQ